MSTAPEYVIWCNMKKRCGNHPHYLHVKVCERWQSFQNFFADMGFRPSPAHSIDRIDNNGDYEPGNCRWATWFQQATNRRNTVFVVYGGERIPLAEAIVRSGRVVTFEVARSRMRNKKHKWSIEEILATPAQKTWRHHRSVQ